MITKTKGGRHCRVQGDGSYRQVLIGDITGHKQKIVVVILSTFGSENHERGTKVGTWIKTQKRLWGLPRPLGEGNRALACSTPNPHMTDPNRYGTVGMPISRI